ncbi:tRNA1(Val) (adenine(37)-N6)-methyltransferase [Aestuariivivens marinum]|uniref:tRNA1(Val) (adenine(37)-N6)-methyltransferase n=1 Tax=Aestuariivivens marinum TaxID=2913555 RepID=UPI001F57160E|nr:methyltransferase [Aestuariivivens marinum]
MSDNPFVFKKFTVKQDRCAMKVGTDGVLLGAWSPVHHRPLSILDIGSGTGIVALMMAQRSNAQLIDTIEIDNNAFEQCVDNFEQSPWNNRLFCYHASLEAFVNEIDDQYDLIVSNPPFYTEDFKTNNTQRDTARFQDAMPFDHLIDGVSKLLSENGLFSVVIPFKEENHFVELASKTGLFPKHFLHVKGNPNSEIKRSLIAFSFDESAPINKDILIIETDRHQYTEDYINLTKDFYLNM